MRTTATKILSFEAAHSLPDHDGKCRRLHGHNYRVEVTVGGRLQESGPARGMVTDFGVLEAEVSRLVVEPLDHRNLNDLFSHTPTAEVVAEWMFETLVENELPVVRVRLWETPTSFVEVSSPEQSSTPASKGTPASKESRR